MVEKYSSSKRPYNQHGGPRRLTNAFWPFKGSFLCSKKQPSFSGNTQVAVLCRLKAVACGENSEIQPAGSRRNEPHSSQRLQANHTRFPHTTTTASSVFTHQNRQGNEDNILSGSSARNSAANGRVLSDNFRSLFSPYGRETSSTSSSSVQSPSASKRRKRNAFFFKRETWTHEFFCLADKDQMVVPSRSLKIQLLRFLFCSGV